MPQSDISFWLTSLLICGGILFCLSNALLSLWSLCLTKQQLHIYMLLDLGKLFAMMIIEVSKGEITKCCATK